MTNSNLQEGGILEGGSADAQQGVVGYSALLDHSRVNSALHSKIV